MHNSKRHAGHKTRAFLRAFVLLAVLWGSAVLGAQAQQEHTETLEQATGADTINYARMQYQMAVNNEQTLKAMDRQAAAARFRQKIGGALLLAVLVFFIIRSRKAKSGAAGNSDSV